MKPYVTDERTKRVAWKGYSKPNRGVEGKQTAVKKWRSRKSARRFARVQLQRVDPD